MKNQATRRAEYLRRWTDTQDRVLFLTGTPMENRVEEFRSLVQYLQPEVAHTVRNVDGVAGAAAFRTAVASVYLRRNQEDVLQELPERLDAEDWVELSAEDSIAYRGAVADRNFMAMRRATLLTGPRSAKLQRLLEILEESQSNGWKVVVFSYFRDVLEVVGRQLATTGHPVHGPLTGAVAPAMRQQLIDNFGGVPGYAVLLSQIGAGGTGLNMQAASVVVLTEPQWKPSIEEQAIARCHRMGQVRRVHVHRLLAEEGVDRRMLEVLAQKRLLIDEYARRSSLKEMAPDAVDIADDESARAVITERQVEREIIEQERVRLGLTDATARPNP